MRKFLLLIAILGLTVAFASGCRSTSNSGGSGYYGGSSSGGGYMPSGGSGTR